MKNLLEYIDEAIVKKPRTSEYTGTYYKGKYDAVDLGLSVKWANCNIGSSRPEEPGLLFQWGRIDGYEYGDKNHKFLTRDDYVTASGRKYNNNDILDLKDDAAAINMIGNWRMPTEEEINELLVSTLHEYIEINGMSGWKFTAKNGNSIFIPMSGCFFGDNCEFYGIKSYGGLWAATAKHHKAAELYMDDDVANDNYDIYCYALPVRGVCK